LLDEGIDALSHGERAVVMLRFFERKSFREVGTALGKSEDAAQKQCERALQRLAAFLQKRGAQLTIAALGAGLGSLLTSPARQLQPQR
jgi:DNA-directed RNA polymerase specialized sigma24 family protein